MSPTPLGGKVESLRAEIIAKIDELHALVNPDMDEQADMLDEEVSPTVLKLGFTLHALELRKLLHS